MLEKKGPGSQRDQTRLLQHALRSSMRAGGKDDDGAQAMATGGAPLGANTQSDEAGSRAPAPNASGGARRFGRLI